jgi:hypothetical protein
VQISWVESLITVFQHGSKGFFGCKVLHETNVPSRILKSIILKISPNLLAVFAVGYFKAMCTGLREKGWQRMALALKNEPGAEVVVCANGVPVGPGSGNPSSIRISMAVVSRESLSAAFEVRTICARRGSCNCWMVQLVRRVHIGNSTASLLVIQICR